MDLQKEIKDLETKLTPTNASGVCKGMINVLKLGTGNLDDKELMRDLFQLGMLHYITFIEDALKDATKNKSTDESADGPRTEDPVVGDTDQPDQVCERD